MVALLSENATAEVLDSGFPVEEGPKKISVTSFPHILGDSDGTLSAELWQDYVLLRSKDGKLDMAVRLMEQDGKIGRIEYLTIWHRLDDVRKIAEERGIPVQSTSSS